jgi:hypothetical protein
MQATRVSSTVHPLTRGLPVDDLGTLFDRYDLPGAYDEMFDASGRPREHYRPLIEELLAAPQTDLRRHQVEADKAFLAQGITFTVYGDAQGTERIFPFDLLPRMLTAREWTTIERGLTQRLTAINLFLRDEYHEGITRRASCRNGWCPVTSSTAAAITAARCAACASTATSTCRSPAPI